jgi:hypothetical protein
VWCRLVETNGAGVATVLDTASVVLSPLLSSPGSSFYILSETSLNLGATITVPGTGTVSVALSCIEDAPGAVNYHPDSSSPKLRALRVDTLDSIFSF